MATKTSFYIPELRLTVFCYPNERVKTRKKLLSAHQDEKVTLGSNLRTGLKKYERINIIKQKIKSNQL